ncbi:MAG: hypothetical protein ACR2QL_08605, partial [Woeseiaceae bacterium]
MTEFPAFNVMSSNVVTSVDAAYNNLSVDTYQLGDGVPQFEFRCLAYSDFEILLNKESHASVNDFRVTDGTTMIGFLGANTPSARWCGIEISPDTLFICPSGRDYLAAVPAGYCGICIQISNDLLSEEEILPDAFMTPGEVSSRWVLPIGQKGTEFCLWLLSILNRNSKVLE